MPPPLLHGTVRDSDLDLTDPGRISESDLMPPFKEEVFDKLYEEAMLDSLSSEGELSDIANRERCRFMQNKIVVPVPTMIKSEPPGPSSSVLTDWPGEYKFCLGFPDNTKPRDPQYSTLLNKLYICQNSNATIKLFATNPPSNKSFSLKAAMVFTSPDHSMSSVRVCYQHSHTSAGKLKDPLAPHLLRLSSEVVETRYLQFSDTGKHLVVLDNLPRCAGPEKFVPVTIKFADLGSCPGGINRRETAVVFRLELEGVCVGRAVLPVRVCTCPKRDRMHDEKAEGSRNKPILTGGQQLSEERKFWVLANGKDNYEALRKVGELFEKNKGGDVTDWLEEVERMNKRPKLDKE